MWALVKADLKYNWLYLAIPSALVLAVCLANYLRGWSTPEMDLPGTRTIMMTMTAVIYFFRKLRQILEKRDRYLALLPHSLRSIGFSRLCLGILVWLSYLSVYFVLSASVRPYRLDLIVWEALSITGFVIFGNAFPFIYRDLFYVFIPGRSKPFVIMSYVVLVLLGVLTFLLFSVTEYSWALVKVVLPLRQYFAPLSTAFLGAILFIFLAVAGVILSVSVFVRRRSLVE